MGLIGKNRNLINGIFYNSISEPNNGVLIVSNNGKTALIDEFGNYILFIISKNKFKGRQTDSNSNFGFFIGADR